MAPRQISSAAVTREVAMVSAVSSAEWPAARNSARIVCASAQASTGISAGRSRQVPSNSRRAVKAEWVSPRWGRRRSLSLFWVRVIYSGYTESGRDMGGASQVDAISAHSARTSFFFRAHMPITGIPNCLDRVWVSMEICRFFASSIRLMHKTVLGAISRICKARFRFRSTQVASHTTTARSAFPRQSIFRASSSSAEWDSRE